MNTEYNSIVRRNRVKNNLLDFRMSMLLCEGVTEKAPLEQTYKAITKLAPQVPRSNQGDAHEVEFLRNAVAGSVWTTEPLSRIATRALSFQQQHGESMAARHLLKEARLAVAHASASEHRPSVTQEGFGTLVTGQGARSVGGQALAHSRTHARADPAPTPDSAR